MKKINLIILASVVFLLIAFVFGFLWNKNNFKETEKKYFVVDVKSLGLGQLKFAPAVSITSGRVDTDGDGLFDDAEEFLGKDVNKVDFELNGADADGDGLSDSEEKFFGTDSSNFDSNGDGIGDGAEFDTFVDQK